MLAHSRLFRLALLLALFILPALSLAQTPPVKPETAAPGKDTVLFDFDGGNYEGWTPSGDCWNTQPATAKTFVDRQGNSLVTGIIGTGFLISQYKNPAATGKAVSRDFTIDKPFLTFKIGGGHFPNQACLNLLVDGKIVRSETGSDSTELRPTYWDVYALMGKTAHLEVVDATPVPNRGYIMVDDFRLSEKPQGFLSKNYTPTFINNRGETAPLSSELISVCRSVMSRVSVQTVDCKRDFGVSTDELYAALIHINQTMVSSELDHSPSRTPLQLANLIKFKVTPIADSFSQEYKTAMTVEQQKNTVYFLKFSAFFEWVRTHVLYDVAIERKYNAGGTVSIKPLDEVQPTAVCGGFSWLVVQLCTLAGMDKVSMIECKNHDAPSQIGHGWNAAQLPTGVYVFCSPSNGAISLKAARARKGLTFSIYTPNLETWIPGAYLLMWHPVNKVGGVIKNGVVNQRLVQGEGNYYSKEATGFFTGIKWAEWNDNWRVPPVVQKAFDFANTDYTSALIDTRRSF